MKTIVLCLLVVIGATQVANADQDAQDRYEEWVGVGLASNTARELACYSHRYHVAVEAQTKGKKLPVYSDPCGTFAMTSLDSLGLMRTAAGDKAIAEMWAFGLDAGYSEGLECMSLIRGKPLLPALRALDLKKARQQCVDLVSRELKEFPKANINHICLPEDGIKSRLDGIIGEIEAGKICDPWNFD